MVAALDSRVARFVARTGGTMDIRRVEWTIHNSNRRHSGTDTPISIEILRDRTRIAYVWLEPGRTPRLTRGAVERYFWNFESPSGIGVAVSGKVVPYTVPFDKGFGGHLRVVFRAWGDDLWRVGTIESAVVEGEMDFTEGTIDAWEWVETRHAVTFSGEDVLSTDADEGTVNLTLNY